MTPPRPAAFFDRDGVVNVSPGLGYVERWADFHFSPGILEVLKQCKEAGFATVLVTSQQGVGKGLMSQQTLDDIHQRMQEALGRHGAAFDGVEACTHLAGTCSCRKPSPEMILRSAGALDLDLSRSFLVGDHERDIVMAQRAGLPVTVRVVTDKAVGVCATHTVTRVEDLAAVVPNVLFYLGNSPKMR